MTEEDYSVLWGIVGANVLIIIIVLVIRAAVAEMLSWIWRRVNLVTAYDAARKATTRLGLLFLSVLGMGGGSALAVFLLFAPPDKWRDAWRGSSSLRCCSSLASVPSSKSFASPPAQKLRCSRQRPPRE